MCLRVICGAAIILVSAEEVSVRVICVAAVILVSAERVSVSLICGAAVILAQNLGSTLIKEIHLKVRKSTLIREEVFKLNFLN